RRSVRTGRSASRARTRGAWVVESLSRAWGLSFLIRGPFPGFAYGPADGPPDLQVTADLTPQVCVRLRAGGRERTTVGRVLSDPPNLPGPEGPGLPVYFEYNSTISCSCTGRLICSRVGIETTRPVMVFVSNESHSGIPRPLTSSIACSIVGFF